MGEKKGTQSYRSRERSPDPRGKPGQNNKSPYRSRERSRERPGEKNTPSNRSQDSRGQPKKEETHPKSHPKSHPKLESPLLLHPDQLSPAKHETRSVFGHRPRPIFKNVFFDALREYAPNGKKGIEFAVVMARMNIPIHNAFGANSVKESFFGLETLTEMAYPYDVADCAVEAAIRKIATMRGKSRDEIEFGEDDMELKEDEIQNAKDAAIEILDKYKWLTERVRGEESKYKRLYAYFYMFGSPYSETDENRYLPLTYKMEQNLNIVLEYSDLLYEIEKEIIKHNRSNNGVITGKNDAIRELISQMSNPSIVDPSIVDIGKMEDSVRVAAYKRSLHKQELPSQELPSRKRTTSSSHSVVATGFEEQCTSNDSESKLSCAISGGRKSKKYNKSRRARKTKKSRKVRH